MSMDIAKIVFKDIRTEPVDGVDGTLKNGQEGVRHPVLCRTVS